MKTEEERLLSRLSPDELAMYRGGTGSFPSHPPRYGRRYAALIRQHWIDSGIEAEVKNLRYQKIGNTTRVVMRRIAA